MSQRQLPTVSNIATRSGSDVALEALREAWHGKRMTSDDIWHYAKNLPGGQRDAPVSGKSGMSGQNIGASIRNRLLNKARAEKLDFNLLLTRYALERMLYRLSISPQHDQFLLKGALLFDLWFDVPHRPTHDADLLGFGSPKFRIWKRFFGISAALKSRMASCSSPIP